MNASGGHCNVDYLITMAHQWEMAHGQAPDKEIETAYSTASCTPKYSAQEIKKVQATMDKPVDTSKQDQLDAKLDKLIALASTTFTKREPSKDRYTTRPRDTSSTKTDHRARSTERRPPQLKRTQTPRPTSYNRSRSSSTSRVTIATPPTNITTVNRQFMYHCEPCSSLHAANKVCHKYQKKLTEN